MARRYPPSPPKLLLSLVSAIITAIILVYGMNLGWLSVHMYYLYIFSVIYYFVICKGDKTATCYTIAGSVMSVFFLLAVKFLDPILGSVIGIAIAVVVAFMTDVLLKCDWRYFSLGDFNFSAFPIEQSIQFRYDQHVPVSEVRPAAETLESDTTGELRRHRKKSDKKPLSRKEKKAEAKKQRKDKGKS